MNLLEEFLTQLGVFTNDPNDISHTIVDDTEFTIVDGEEGDYGLIKYFDDDGFLLAIRKVEGGDAEETFFTKHAISRLRPMAEKWLVDKINATFTERNILQE